MNLMNRASSPTSCTSGPCIWAACRYGAWQAARLARCGAFALKQHARAPLQYFPTPAPAQPFKKAHKNTKFIGNDYKMSYSKHFDRWLLLKFQNWKHIGNRRMFKWQNKLPCLESSSLNSFLVCQNNNYDVTSETQSYKCICIMYTRVYINMNMMWTLFIGPN